VKLHELNFVDKEKGTAEEHEKISDTLYQKPLFGKLLY